MGQIVAPSNCRRVQALMMRPTSSLLRTEDRSAELIMKSFTPLAMTKFMQRFFRLDSRERPTARKSTGAATVTAAVKRARVPSSPRCLSRIPPPMEKPMANNSALGCKARRCSTTSGRSRQESAQPKRGEVNSRPPVPRKFRATARKPSSRRFCMVCCTKLVRLWLFRPGRMRATRSAPPWTGSSAQCREIVPPSCSVSSSSRPEEDVGRTAQRPLHAVEM
mmetsp:Transcript_88222/g.274214  ORF Transcript_88222/g.274214 Transcript_88222/m.274214 type:complete len:221 (+) Transcript_88222:274-936(+)